MYCPFCQAKNTLLKLLWDSDENLRLRNNSHICLDFRSSNKALGRLPLLRLEHARYRRFSPFYPCLQRKCRIFHETAERFALAFSNPIFWNLNGCGLRSGNLVFQGIAQAGLLVQARHCPYYSGRGREFLRPFAHRQGGGFYRCDFHRLYF